MFYKTYDWFAIFIYIATVKNICHNLVSDSQGYEVLLVLILILISFSNTDA